jgi:hypothetical protein
MKTALSTSFDDSTYFNRQSSADKIKKTPKMSENSHFSPSLHRTQDPEAQQCQTKCSTRFAMMRIAKQLGIIVICSTNIWNALGKSGTWICE